MNCIACKYISKLWIKMVSWKLFFKIQHSSTLVLNGSLLHIYYFNMFFFSIQDHIYILKMKMSICDYNFKCCILFRKHWIYPAWLKVVPWFFLLFFSARVCLLKHAWCHVALLRSVRSVWSGLIAAADSAS